MTAAIILIIWTVFCLGISLTLVSWKARTTGEVLGETVSNLGVGIVFWSAGIGVWMVAGFIMRAF